jgi:hypothetical protein
MSAFIFCLCRDVQVAPLRPADPPTKESYQLPIRLRNWKKRPEPTMGCRAISSSSSSSSNSSGDGGGDGT